MKFLLLFGAATVLQAQIISGVFTGTFGTASVANPTTSNSGGSCSGSDGAGWSCTGTTTVSILDATSGSTKCYRTDGTNPAATTPGTCDAGSTTYSSGISTASTATFKMLGTKSGFTNSSVVVVTYTISGGGGITLISACHGAAGSAGGGVNPAVLTGVNCTGATSLHIVAVDFSATPTTDTITVAGNTFTARGPGYADSGGTAVRIYDSVGATVSGSMTFTVTGTDVSFCVLGFSGVTSFDQVVGASGVSPGTITPANANSLFFAGLGSQSNITSIDSGFTITDNLANSPGNYLAAACAYLIQSGGPTAVSPNWSPPPGTDAGTVASYNP